MGPVRPDTRGHVESARSERDVFEHGVEWRKSGGAYQENYVCFAVPSHGFPDQSLLSDGSVPEEEPLASSRIFEIQPAHCHLRRARTNMSIFTQDHGMPGNNPDGSGHMSLLTPKLRWKDGNCVFSSVMRMIGYDFLSAWCLRMNSSDIIRLS